MESVYVPYLYIGYFVLPTTGSTKRHIDITTANYYILHSY